MNQTPNRRYTPTQAETNTQVIKELSSRVQSLEDAVKQLQSTTLPSPQAIPAPLGVNLDEVAPPPWLDNPPTNKKAKLLLPRGGQAKTTEGAAAEQTGAPLLKTLLPRTYWVMMRLLVERDRSKFATGLAEARVYKMTTSGGHRCIELELTPEKSAMPDDSTNGFHVWTPDGGELIFTVSGGAIRKIQMVNFAAASRDVLSDDKLPDPFSSILC